MNVSVLRRGLAACAILTAAALVAVGCGGTGSGSGSSGAADAAKDAKGLDFVPAGAIMYVTFDTDLNGDNWQNVDDLAPAFFKDVKPIDQYIEDASKDSKKNKVDFKKDVEPWLGDTAGLAITAIATKGDTKGDPEVFAWVDIKDRGKFEKFAKDQDLKKTGSAGDFDLWHDESDDENGGNGYLAVGDDIVLFADSKDAVSERAKFDGDSIKDADGISDVVDKVEGEALVAMVVNGDGVRDALKASDDDTAAQVAKNKEFQKFDGLSLSVSAEDKGFHVHGFVGTDGLDERLLGTNGSTDLVKDLPGDTIVAFGGNDLGGSIKSLLDVAGDSDPAVDDAVGQIQGFLGVSPEDLAKAFKDEWTFALGGSDEGFQGLAGGAMGAAMGGGLDPSSLGDVGATLAFAANGDTKGTMEKLFGASQMVTGTPPKEGKAGDFDTLTSTIGGMPVTAATTDELALVTTDATILDGWGTGDGLGDNKAFKDAWAAADAPDKVSSVFFLDWPRVAGIAGIPAGKGAEAGGWVGWSETDGDDASFDLFMHAEKK